MILYCDTSAVVKRYVREDHSDEVRKAWRAATRVATSEVAFAETVAAVARRWRLGDLTGEAHGKLRERFLLDFRTLVRVPVSDELNRRIVELVLAHPLRGFDAIHLSSALLLKEQVRAPVVFACFDGDLASVAQAAGLDLL
ncbi:MAG: type II toxin-antitoxin system VapC family toxin [Deltaproteobacteria bacterium]|nr:type II toxin-antitoxin system VapC family toxin [Deltaproteobacteria bacterium]